MPTLQEWIECEDLPVKTCNGYRKRHGYPLLPCDSGVATPEKTSVPLWKKAASFASAATKHILAGRPKASPEQIQARLEICRACELFERNHCKQCGCACNGTANFMNKLAWADQECPHPAGPKWGTTGSI